MHGREEFAMQLSEHRSVLMRIATLQLRDKEAAEDAVQEALAAAVAAGESYAGKGTVRTWLVGILKYKIADTHRLRQREVAIENDAAGEIDESSSDDLDPRFIPDGHFKAPPADWDDPARSLEERRFYESLDVCLERLPINTARAFMLREVMDCDTPEICRQMDVSANHVGVLLYRARLLLRECLERGWFARGSA